MSSYKLSQSQTTSEDRILQDKGYKLQRQIGEGGYAKVYLGEFQFQKQDPIRLACKVVNTTKAPKRYVVKFLPRELKILVKLTHPHIIQVHSIFYRKSKYYIFMRYAELGDLLDYVLRNGAIAEHQARIWARQISLGLQYLHILEIAHRDLKCENILITMNNNVKISDFGFAKYLIPQGVLSETYCGSLSYAPPEILKGEPYDAKIADLWSFGILIYTMLNRANPFDSKNVKILYQNQIQKKWKFRTRYAEKVSEEVVNLIGNLLEPEITQRYKIENVLSSPWIEMDPKLRALTPNEFEALSDALEHAKSFSRSGPSDSERHRHLSSVLKKINPNRNSLTFFKEHEEGFDLTHIRSEFDEQSRKEIETIV